MPSTAEEVMTLAISADSYCLGSLQEGIGLFQRLLFHVLLYYRQAMNEKNEKSQRGLIPPHGGYRNLKTYQAAPLVYDATVLFCDRYIDPRPDSRSDGSGRSQRRARTSLREAWPLQPQKRQN